MPPLPPPLDMPLWLSVFDVHINVVYIIYEEKKMLFTIHLYSSIYLYTMYIHSYLSYINMYIYYILLNILFFQMFNFQNLSF